MPTEFIKKLSKKSGKSTKTGEKLWNKAKKIAKDQGKENNFAIITTIYKKMIKESTLLDYINFKELTNI
jgi:poly-D-alanine transfer protein DltD